MGCSPWELNCAGIGLTRIEARVSPGDWLVHSLKSRTRPVPLHAATDRPRLPRDIQDIRMARVKTLTEVYLDAALGWINVGWIRS